MDLEEFKDRVNTCENREKLEKHAGIGALYDLIESLGWWGRLRMRCAIRRHTTGEERKGLLKAFDMHSGLKRALKRGADLPHADGI